jgi:hypothetical protein
MRKPDREGGRYAEDGVSQSLSISPLLTRGLVHVLPAFANITKGASDEDAFGFLIFSF